MRKFFVDDQPPNPPHLGKLYLPEALFSTFELYLETHFYRDTLYIDEDVETIQLAKKPFYQKSKTY